MKLSRTILPLAVALAAAAPAQASFPGANGDLVVSQDTGSLVSDLFSLPPGGGALTRLTDAAPRNEDEDGYVGGPEAAPDGESILAFSTDVASGIATYPAGGGDLVEIPNPLELRYDPSGFSPPLSWSPDGTEYATVTEDGVVAVPLGGEAVREVVPADGRRFLNAVWSPNGKWVAVEVAGGKKRAGLWIYDARTGDRVRRVARRGLQPDWSPDSRRLVYRTGYQHDEDGGASGGNLYVVGRDGKGKRTLVHRERVAETEPTWSPDGKRIAWISLGFGAGDVSFDVRPSVWTVKAKGGKPKRVRKLAVPYIEEGYFHAPELTWLPTTP